MFSAPSLMSLPISAVRQGTNAGGDIEDIPVVNGTAFIVNHAGQDYLVTNWHMITGRSPVDGTPLGGASLPEKVVGWLVRDFGPTASGVGWHAWGWDLYDSTGHARWLVHPTLGSAADVVALPIPPAPSIDSGHPEPTKFYPYSIDPPERPAALYPTSDVSIIGFPFGLTAGGKLPIWTRGSVASEPAANYDGQPCFLVDARTREQQSGSPVVGYWIGPRVLANGTTYVGGEAWELFGVYSGRTSSTSDLGKVWRREVIKEVIEGGRFDELVFE